MIVGLIVDVSADMVLGIGDDMIEFIAH